MQMSNTLTDSDILHYIKTEDRQEMEQLFSAARQARMPYYGNTVYVRGLIEFTNYCKNNCYYCGIRAGNKHISRYRLSMEQILNSCTLGHLLGYRTFVLQGGEDPFFTDERIVSIVAEIHRRFPDSAITLSLGERERESYERFFYAGARRYLLRHETANEIHYQRLHPAAMSLAHRKHCLFVLKDIGYQVGAGFMVGTPYQTAECLVEDLRFLEELQPAMVGIGPFIPHKETPFAQEPCGSIALSLRMIALSRLILPRALIPATTAMGTAAEDGRERALYAGANVVMPNLSPTSVRPLYALYDNKICTREEAAACRFCIEQRINTADMVLDMQRGDQALESINCSAALDQQSIRHALAAQ
ncbi:MAG: [FeFe] hydrogenase H-cluster radical SAM maturase HydE [Treponema sp.]|jgi:biotin synthase|nr:[FeFe] hydrogenase H-cluster radical SAM maturase HydE [Treponema sp.]